MLIVLFITGLAAGGLTIWLLWAQGILLALFGGMVVASVAVGALSFVIDARRSRGATKKADAARGVPRALDSRRAPERS